MKARYLAVAVVGVVYLILSFGETASAQPFRLAPDRPDIDRWMYPFNSTPGTRPVAAVFSTFGDESGVDTRHGQFILAWNTGPSIPAGLPADRYLIRSARLTVTVTRGDAFVNVGAPTFPELATAENLLHEPPRLLVEGAVVGSGDADGDGLPDDWERFHFGGLPALPDADPDGDGSPNLAEWQDGTDPTIPDALRIQAERRADGRMSLWWPGVANGTDTLESSADLQHWAPVSGTLDYRERGIVRWATDVDAGSAFRCYRVRRMPSAP